MADQKISQLTTISTVDTAADLFPIVDTSATETKKITPSALKTALALNNVDNTSDANKPISSATQTALDGKQATLVSGTNIKTINSTSILGSGDISISGSVSWGGVTGTLSNQTDLQNALDAKQNSLGFTAENSANKSTSVTTDQASNTKYPSVKAVYDWAVGLFATIANLATKTDKNITTNTQTSSYTLVPSDADKNVEMNVATANNLTIPAGTFVAGQQIIVVQYGTGQTTIVAGVGMTLRSVGGYLKIGAQYGAVTIIFRSATEAIVIGNLSV